MKCFLFKEYNKKHAIKDEDTRNIFIQQVLTKLHLSSNIYDDTLSTSFQVYTSK